MTADFWGLRGAGGTATAYHLLAAVLSKHAEFEVRHASLWPIMTHKLLHLLSSSWAAPACSEPPAL